ncbi:NAD(P)-dependent alcohol dehydrogenase [Luteimonas sp. BDR2-5]|uniref:NAD(P)-dependent alcohol dehydrogenase n=1 Tax=Proluteimonas luteida TaxID=2878685 RepID=UPI001E4181BF|nr:NAD(P)-dependent alcohol dehydrogenase [Luteimonas sp. BDR2-5]MCD9026801.1 NAD(P)-dependent alcohol dehydrogenase [Luteimonas sp. BDR2-5]
MELLDIDEHDLRPTEVLVELVATGLCHTDLAARDGDFPIPFPSVLGHEGAGIVAAVGPAVTAVAPGDRVVLCPASCTVCDQCRSGHPSYCRQMWPLNLPGPRADGSFPCRDAAGHPVNGGFFGQSSLATACIAHESNVVKITENVPLERLGPLGCGMQTGAGAVINVLRPAAGEGIGVFGVGPVGLAAVMAAKAAGCLPIVAIDINEQRLGQAMQLGATHGLLSGEGEVSRHILDDICAQGLHYSIDTTGRNDVIEHAMAALMPRGRCLLLAVPSTPTLEIPWSVMTAGRSLEYVQEGDSVPGILIPQLIALHLAGLFPFDRLIRFYELDELDRAVADFEEGRVIKAVIRMQVAPTDLESRR